LKPQGCVRPQDQRELFALRKAENSVDGVCRTVTPDLSIIYFEAVDVGGRQPDHLQTVGGPRQLTITLLPWLPCRYEQHPIETSLMESRLPGVEMSHVDRIECPPKDAGAHDAEDRATVASPTEGHD
jgi:hypothetical protein